MNAEVPPVMPPQLSAQGYRLRGERETDLPFLLKLYASTRAEELATVTGWTEPQKAVFVAQQFNAQRLHFQTRIAGCGFWIIECRGAQIGRLYLQDAPDHLHIVDVALMPDKRGAGVGSAILAALLAQADAAAKPVSLNVEQTNIAQRLYHRLGFVITETNGIRYRMERAARGFVPISLGVN
ncbi:GNAT family N-acetyltransferase [Sphingomonas sp. 37zxx]|uniref:GNAT family N-acetyltransferase n=1 Tax=Sphingomonas sp. 37zxx TaxID=1550073 RepID=UPI00068F2A20|nr:GNAT family N-acetyltransferase [Sphingomonas sp. 37zxx]